MDVEEAGYIMGYALCEQDGMVRNALGHQSDEALDALYRAWHLLGTCLGDEFDRRGDAPMTEEWARRMAQRYAEELGLHSIP